MTGQQPRRPPSRVMTWVVSRRAALVTVLAGVLVWVSLALPSTMGILLNRSWYFQLPLAALILGVAAVSIPRRALRVVALIFGTLIGALVIVKALNIGFHSVFDRGFDIVGDWYYLGPGIGVLTDTTGRTWALVIVGMALLLVVAVLVALPLATMWVTSALARNRRRSVIAVAVLLVVWAGSAATGFTVGTATPLAAVSSSQLAWSTVRQVPSDIADRATFATQIKADPHQASAPLLTGLKGKDVLLVFLESIGQVALTDPSVAPTVNAAFADGQAQLKAAGVSAASGWLTSPTFGGASWLAHSTVESGLWVDSQQRYNQLVSTDRLTLTEAFRSAGWRTVFDIPAMSQPWPEGQPFYHFDKLYTADNVGYKGPTYGYATMPDQFTFSALSRLELTGAPRAPVMAEIDLLSSHYPWTEPPPLLPWDAVGDGSGFAAPGAAPDAVPGVAPSPKQTYADATAYVLRTLASFAATSNDPNLVILAMGDHQPKTSISGTDASHTVPTMLITRDSDVLARISNWGWTPGLHPAPDAPNWPMSDLRDRIFATFGAEP
ncbi:MAG: hypothetical protein ABI382_01615 [Nakamurella sp.]